MNDLDKEYKFGFSTDIEADTLPVGLNEDIIRKISFIKNEPEFLLNYRLKAYNHWLTMSEPAWAGLNFPTKPDYQAMSYYSAPKKSSANDGSQEIDPELLKLYEKLGVPLQERDVLSGVAIDAVFDSVSVATTFKKQLKEIGVIFCSFSEAVRDYPELIEQYMGSVVPYTDNFYACLNSAVFGDGSFCYIPKGVRCPVDLSTYFRINQANVGQFERTLIIAEEDSYVSYLEGCTAPRRDNNQFHAAIVELVAHKNATIKYSTIQNWYPGDKNGVGGVYNLVTKRGLCLGENSNISWSQVETGSAITWKYPSVILKGDNSVGNFSSISFTKHHQQADTGTKMIHLGKNTRSSILAKSIATDSSTNTYRGLVRIASLAENSKNISKCDSLMLADACTKAIPLVKIANNTSQVEHEATISRINEEQLHYLEMRGLGENIASTLIVNGFCKQIFDKLPLEFSAEANGLIEYCMEKE